MPPKSLMARFGRLNRQRRAQTLCASRRRIARWSAHPRARCGPICGGLGSRAPGSGPELADERVDREGPLRVLCGHPRGQPPGVRYQHAVIAAHRLISGRVGWMLASDEASVTSNPSCHNNGLRTGSRHVRSWPARMFPPVAGGMTCWRNSISQAAGSARGSGRKARLA